MKNSLEDYRKGAVGALMDEYERAALELKSVVENIDKDNYESVADAETEDKSCRSVQTIMSHVVFAGYAYANYIRDCFSTENTAPESEQIGCEEIGGEIEKMLDYTIETLDGKWEMTDEEICRIKINSRWGVSYDLEQMLEHAIVHVLRHRRQIEKFLLRKMND